MEDIKIIFEDRDILVLHKPAGVIVNRSDTTKEEKTVQDWVEGYLKIHDLKSQIPNKSKISNSNGKDSLGFSPSADGLDLEFLDRAGIVHRLDKETSGILIVAKTSGSFENLQSQFKERKVKKTYIALVHGKVDSSQGEINAPLGRLPWNRKRFGVIAGGREAITKYKILNIKYKIADREKEPLTLLELYPETGRTHQIRVHLRYINHPVFADPLYAGRKTARNDRMFLPRVFLHASKISLSHPKTGQLISFEAKLPKELSDFVSRLSTLNN